MIQDKYFQNIVMTSKEYESERKYWFDKLNSETSLSAFPIDYTRSKLNFYNRDFVNIQINEPSFKKIMMYGNKSEYGAFLILLSAINYITYRYTGNKEVVVGIPVFTQNLNTDYINNILAIKTLVDNNKSFKDLLIKVKTEVEEANKHKNFPFEVVADVLNLNGDKEFFPLINIVVLLKGLHDYKAVEKINADLVFEFDIKSNTIDLDIVYNSNIFRKSIIEQIATHIETFIESATKNIDIKLKDIELLSSLEINKLLYEFNDTKTDYEKNKTLHKIFENRVSDFKTKTAIVYEGKEYTYDEINKKANKLARILRTKGVTNNSVVGLIIDRSPEMIIGILAILKAGGCYLPIDIEQPQNRIVSMLNDSGATVVISKQDIINDFSFIALQNVKENGICPELTPKRPQIMDLASIPLPDRTLVDCEKYFKHIGIAMAKNTISIMATRGCPYNCAYCHKIWPKKHVVRPAENIFEEVSRYYNVGAKRFAFIDDIFNLDIENSARFFHMVIESGMKIQIFFPTGVRADLLTDEYIDLMVEAGVVNISLALETASPRLQKYIGKNVKLEKLKHSIDYITEKYPHVITELFSMHGFPTETEEEAKMTLDFIKSVKWIHFPYFHILKIFHGTEMAKLALENGITQESIDNSVELAFHELPDTLPFPKSFSQMCQTEFINEYFLSKERLIEVLPHQIKILTEDELCQKYDSYLPIDIKCLDDLLNFVEIDRSELGDIEFAKEEEWSIPNFNNNIKKYSTSKEPEENALRILYLDLSQFFSADSHILYDVIEPPIGHMYLQTYLNEKYGSKVHGKLAKARFDFDNYDELKKLILDFKPDIIGVRALSFYRSFFHKTISIIRQWGITVPIISGGPYSTSDCNTVLRDRNIDVVIIGEGEITLAELVGKILDNNNKMPDENVLRNIPGLAFINQKEKESGRSFNRDILFLDHLDIDNCNVSDENLESVSTSDSLAYIMYTSGSTGKPKGNLTTHYNISRLVKNTNYIKISSEDVLLQLSNYAFDGSTFDIFGALLNGAKLILPNKTTVLDIYKLGKLIEEEHVSVSFITTALFNTLVDTNIDCLKSTRKLLFGGERVSLKHVNDALNVLGRDKLIHVYGPTESTVFATYYNINEVDENAITVPIGKPLSNTQVYILDKDDKIQPIGVAGELCIGGDGLVKGYLNRPELTKEKFVTDKYTQANIIYKTGDLARWLPDGNIEFLGRIDTQVKLRGFRIEIGETESVLQKYDSIKEVYVTDRGDESIGRYLCAYYVGNELLDEADVRAFMLKELPEYMIPSYFIKMDKLPLTLNGKINKSMLPDPINIKKIEEEYVPPQNDIERKLQLICQDILSYDKISMTDDFFMLGGHSLKAAILVSRIHKEFNVELSISDIFVHTKIRELSEKIIQSKQSIFSSIQPVGIKKYYVASSAQKRMYLLNLIKNEDISYNMPFMMMVEGNLNIAKVEDSIIELINRHEALRTSFEFIDGEPVQIVNENAEFSLQYFNSNENKINDIIKSFVRPFDLSKAPLLRCGIINISDNKNILLLDLHHIISDGVSIGVIFKDFADIYQGKKLASCRIQYKDYAQWQVNLIRDNVFERQKKYWINVFSGEIPVLNMPTDYQRPANQMSRGDNISFSIDKDLTNMLNKLAEDSGTTMYVLLLAALNVLLHKYTGQDDIIIGSPVAGRPHADLESMVGVFINTIAMRNFPKDDIKFKDFLENVKNNSVKALENQNYPFEDLVEQLNVSRDLSRNPLFDVMFNYQNACDTEIKIDELRFSQYDYDYQTAKFDLTLGAELRDGKLEMGFEYFTDLFKKETIETLAIHFVNLLHQVAQNVEIKLSDIDMLTLSEKNKIINDFNNTYLEYPKEMTINGLFEEQVLKSPNSISITFNETSITYKQMNEMANSLAHILREKGVTSKSIVGIMVRRSPKMLIGIMAILKAGGAYLPIDPSYPVERIKYMISDSNTQILLTQKDLLQLDDLNCNKLFIDDETNFRGNNSNIEQLNTATDLAYVIYTSGSTGKPKGVMIEHKAVNNFINGISQKIDFSSGKTILALTTLSFDIFLLETLLPLTKGMRVVIADEYQQLDAKLLEEVLIKENVDILQITPSRMQMMITSGLLKGIKGLKEILIGGEEVPKYLINEIFNITDAKIYNVYGPTETTVWSTVKELDAKNDINIGKPIANTQIYILDKSNNILPIGIVGELCIAGDGLARGYYNNDTLTQQKFVANPFRNSERMYRTGDLAKWLPDGNIEFLGRVDYQLKIRGYRIEPGEIEGCLKEIDTIKECAVVMREDSSGHKYLAAFYVSDKNVELSKIRNHLSNRLPEYMIPATFIKLDKLPVTQNGKINKGALPDIKEKAVISKETYVEPQTEVESQLVEIWKEILDISIVGVDNNFFEVGGNSMLLVLMHSKISKMFDKKISIADIFANPTISKLAQFIEKSDRTYNLQDIIKQIDFPTEYFDITDECCQEISSIKIDSEVTNKLLKLAENEEVELEDILLSAYIYLIAQISEKSIIPIQTALKENGTIYPVLVSLEDIESMDELYKRVRGCLSQSDIQNCYPAKDVDKVIIKKGYQSIIPLFGRENLLKNSTLNEFDIIFKYQNNTNGLEIFFDYNSLRLNNAGMNKFLSNYMYLINQLIGVNEKHE